MRGGDRADAATPLLARGGAWRRPTTRRLLLAVIGTLAVACVVLPARPAGARASALRAAGAAPRILASNKYGGAPSFASYRFSRGDGRAEARLLVEPARPSTLTLDGASAAPAWRLEGADAAGAALRGDVVTADRPGSFRVVAAVDGRTVASAVAHCRYVRREIRALDAEDRRRYLGALRAMATTPKAAGLAAYGSGFRTVGRRRGTSARETSLLSRPRSARVGRCLDARSSLGALSDAFSLGTRA